MEISRRLNPDLCLSPDKVNSYGDWASVSIVNIVVSLERQGWGGAHDVGEWQSDRILVETPPQSTQQDKDVPSHHPENRDLGCNQESETEGTEPTRCCPLFLFCETRGALPIIPCPCQRAIWSHERGDTHRLLRTVVLWQHRAPPSWVSEHLAHAEKAGV